MGIVYGILKLAKFLEVDAVFNEHQVYKHYLHEKQARNAGDEYMELEDVKESKSSGDDNIQEH